MQGWGQRMMAAEPFSTPDSNGKTAVSTPKAAPTPSQRAWLARGLAQPGGKLPLFDTDGQRINPQTIRACLQRGWAEPWFTNPTKPDWLVCKLTDAGRALLTDQNNKNE